MFSLCKEKISTPSTWLIDVMMTSDKFAALKMPEHWEVFLSIDFGERSVSGRSLTVSTPDTGKSYRVPSVGEIIAIDWSKWRLVFLPKLCCAGLFKFLPEFLLHLL